MERLILCFSLMLAAATAFAEDKILKADFRHRPPEMVVDGQNNSGPLKDIIEEAAQMVGYQIKWRNAPFPRSLLSLEKGKVDIVPRTIRNREREVFRAYRISRERHSVFAKKRPRKPAD